MGHDLLLDLALAYLKHLRSIILLIGIDFVRDELVRSGFVVCAPRGACKPGKQAVHLGMLRSCAVAKGYAGVAFMRLITGRKCSLVSAPLRHRLSKLSECRIRVM
jgi:hypothetical protein